MKLRIITLCLCLLMPAQYVSAQNTVGLTQYLPNETSAGYTLFFPHRQGNVFLIDNCGEIVNVWEDSVYNPGNGTYLHTDGNLYVCKGRGQASNSYIHAGGGGEKIEVRDWNNNLLWDFVANDSMQRLHHDIAVMPNGNVLAIVWDRHLGPDAIANGRDPAFMPDGEVWSESIYEIQDNGTGSGTVVWSWHAWDHLVQDYDSTKLNYGVVANHRELINLNYGSNEDDWLHANGLAYNADLDQIMISVPDFDEIWVIDHSTTTSQAAGHTGGLSKMGGDLMYRWGNPEAYDTGDSTHHKVFFSHNCHWIDIGLNQNHPDYGKVIFFNNQFASDYSAVNIITPIFDDYEWEYPISNDSTFGPSNYAWTYTAPVPQDFHSTGLSSAQRLFNGNTLICEGRDGRIFEIDDMNNIVWEYEVPLIGGNPATQGDTLALNANLTFMATKYRPSYPGIPNPTLTPIGYLELNPDTGYCDNILSIEETESALLNFEIFPNPASDFITVNTNGEYQNVESFEIFDAFGKRIQARDRIMRDNLNVSVRNWPAGVYFLRINENTARDL